MKKLLLMLVACWAALSAHAIDYYLIGGFNDWKEADPDCKFTAQGNGTYVLDYKGTLTSEFKINDGTWKNDAANFGGSATLKEGVTYNLSVGGNSGDIKLDENIVNPHLVFNPTAKTLLITGQTTAIEYIYGIHSNWYETSWSTINMTEENGKWILTQREIPAGTFGIKQMDKSTEGQTAWISADGSSVIVPNEAMKCKVQGTNFTNPAGNFKIIYDPVAMTITFEGTQTGEDVKPDYSSWYVNVQGIFNGWGDNGVHPVDGISTTEGLKISTTGFKIKVYNGSDIYYNTGNTTPIKTNTWVQLQVDDSDGPAVFIEGATSNLEYTVKFNCETNQVYVSSQSGDITPTYPEKMYILGAGINGVENWETGVVMESDAPGIYVWSGDRLSSGFKFFDGSWNNGYNIGASSDENTIGLDDVFSYTNSSDSKNINFTKLSWIENPVVVLDLAAGTVTVNGSRPLYLIGSMTTDADGNWVCNPSYLFTKSTGAQGNDVYTLNVASISSSDEFKIASEDWVVQYTIAEKDLTTGNPYTVVYNADGKANMGLENSLLNATFTLTVDMDDNKTGNLVITGETDKNQLVITPGNDKTEQSGVISGTTINMYTENEGVLIFVYAPGNAKVFYALDGVTPLDKNNVKALAEVDDLNWIEASTTQYENGAYAIPLGVNTTGNLYIKYGESLENASKPVSYGFTVMKSTPTGVEGIEAEAEGEAVYYNLQGVRVENPQKGIFIKVVEGKSSKVVL